MSYMEGRSTAFWHFSKPERKLIEKWLDKNGFEIDKNTVCGDHCGMYAECYYIPKICFDDSDQITKEQAADLKAYLTKHKISCSFGGYTLSANPAEGDYYYDNHFIIEGVES